MKRQELKKIEEYYRKYRSMLFNDDIPAAEDIYFTLHALPFAAGYSKHCEKPLKTGKIHIIAFCKWYTFTDDEIQEILVHEMIHVWQLYHVKEERYKMCSDYIAHDRLFNFKVNQLNLILKREGYFFRLDTRYTHRLRLDDNVTEDVQEHWKKKYHLVVSNKGEVHGYIDYKDLERAREEAGNSSCQ